MPHLYRARTGQPLCAISDDELHQLKSALAADASPDAEYALDADSLGDLAEAGVSEALVNLLAAAIAEDEGLEISWGR